jgi:hypothetical protein
MTSRPLPGPKPPLANIVAVLYRWGLSRYGRNKANPPLEIEQLLGTSKHARPWPRLAVPFVLGLNNLQIIAVTVAPGALLILLAREWMSPPLLAAVVLRLGVLLGMLPLGLLLGVGIWCVLPERRSGGYLRHPGRLRAPSIATWAVAMGMAAGAQLS